LGSFHHAISERYSREKVTGISLLIGFLHGLLSTILSLFVVIVGVYFLPFYEIKMISILLIITACFYILLGALRESGSSSKVAGASVIASVLPDFAALPIIFYSINFGSVYLLSISLIYIASCMISIAFVISLSNKGLSKRLSKVDPRDFDYIVIFVLALTAAYIYLFS